jgi:hypothetical protein
MLKLKPNITKLAMIDITIRSPRTDVCGSLRVIRLVKFVTVNSLVGTAVPSQPAPITPENHPAPARSLHSAT